MKSAILIKQQENYSHIAYWNCAFLLYEKYLSEECLQTIFGDDIYAEIHGDLTIENIILSRKADGEDDFYLIDPNTGNIYNSPNLDYGKILHSIHGGYEFLMVTKRMHANGNRIDFLFTRSSAYGQLHERMRSYMEKQFGHERTRSIYFHEIIHWLRLMSYLSFFADAYLL